MSDNAPSYGIILSNRGPVLDYCTPSDLIDLGVYSEESGVFDLSLIHISEPTRPY